MLQFSIVENAVKWLVFSYSLPSQSGSGPRVALWRRLRRLGAITPVGGMPVLPARVECEEALVWLAQEIRQAQGEAVVMHVDHFEGLDDHQLIDLFRAARREDYIEIETEVCEFEKDLQEGGDGALFKRGKDIVNRLRRRYTEVMHVDYFESPIRTRVAALLTRMEQDLMQGEQPAIHVMNASIGDYQNRVWVTRPRPHVDRLACIWLIRRFIDPSAAIRFDAQPRLGEVTFDMDDGQFAHLGNLCTFETMLLAFNLEDPVLHAMAEIVHSIDLQDARFDRPEITGVEAILAGWLKAGFPDARLEEAGIALFEGLYMSLAN
jgi:hypothetical protein